MPLSRSAQFRNRANVGLLALAFVVILVTSIISVRSTNSLADSIELVSHTLNVKDDLTALQVELGMMEADGLRFMVGGALQHRTGLQTHLDAIGRLLVRLKTLTADNPHHQDALAALARDYVQLESRVRGSIAIKDLELRNGKEGHATERIRDGRGERAVDVMRERVFAMSHEEDRLLSERRLARDALVKQMTATLMIANGLALVAGLLGFLALRRAQRAAENALRGELRAAQARRANEEKSVFLASMSHEIRTPMNAIFGFAQLLGDHVREPLQREWVASIRKSGQMLLGLINDVLDLSKIEAGKLQLNPHGTDLGELATETLALFEPMAEAKGLCLQIEIDPTDLVPVAVDAQRLRQILMNLLSNAVKYTERGEVALHLSMMLSPLGSGRDLLIAVTDTGVGIDPEQLEQIFEPFYQAESLDGRVRQGTGLGLSITRRLVDLMHGSIHVASRPGEGATFRVNIPDLEPATVMPAGVREAPVYFDQLSPLKILVVDDVEWNLEVAKGYLRDSHHQVFVARDGIEGLESVRRLRPDVVLMDLRMPRMNGYRVLEAIRADPVLAATRVIAVTASSLAGEDRALTAHFDGYIRKPYAPLELFATLCDLFAKNSEVRNRIEATPAPMPGQGGIAPTEERLAAAHKEWRTLCGEPLQALRKRMRMREIGDFTQRLESIAEEIRDPELQSLAQRLRLAVQRFDVNQIKLVLDALAVECEQNNSGESSDAE
jgi:signal transduction histidine kinase/DNA-binding NarL/FixJ family response regulator